MLAAHSRIRPSDFGDKRFHSVAQLWPLGHGGRQWTARTANSQRAVRTRNLDVAAECNHRSGRGAHAIGECPAGSATDLES
jgi:hypothetical protein